MQGAKGLIVIAIKSHPSTHFPLLHGQLAPWTSLGACDARLPLDPI